MNYIWEAIIAADREGIPREDLRFVPVRNGSPYTEVVQEILNRKELGSCEIQVNPLYRFAKAFSGVFDINLLEYEKTREILFDAAMHYMAQLDLRQGMSRQEYELRFLLRDLFSGVCGEEADRVVRHFGKDKMRRMLRLILKLYQCGSSIYLFKEVMHCLYPDSLVYASNEAAREVLIYVGVTETMPEQEKLGFLVDMFLPVNYEVYLFWEHHFGIIDVEETMQLDDMVLF